MCVWQHGESVTFLLSVQDACPLLPDRLACRVFERLSGGCTAITVSCRLYHSAAASRSISLPSALIVSPSARWTSSTRRPRDDAGLRVRNENVVFLFLLRDGFSLLRTMILDRLAAGGPPAIGGP